MRARSLVLIAAFSAATLSTIVGCGGPPANSNGSGLTNTQADALNPDVGEALYRAAADVKIAAATLGGEPLVVPNCSVQFEERQQVAAEVDGKIELIAVRDDKIDTKDPLCVYHPRDAAKQVKYRQLKEGDAVKLGQEICFLDDQIWTTKLESARKSKEAAVGIQKAAAEGVNLTEQKLAQTKKATVGSATSQREVLEDQITKTRFEENLMNALQSIYKSEADYAEAQVMLRKHRLTSAVNGVVRTISKHPGDFTKAGEKILEIQATDVVRLEGNLDVQYAAHVKRGMPVTVEPAVPSAPYKTLNLHRTEVTGVAVTADPNRPLVVTTGADGTARVYDPASKVFPHLLPHPVPVRSVACSPVAKPALAVTGSDDGKVRVWDLSAPDKLPATPRELADCHTAAVGAVAFSPDGRFLATAAGREVFVWDVAEGKKLYALPGEHRDAVTSLRFTPQCTLVTASKDRTLKVWKLGAATAAVAKTFDHRAGAVDVLGVTADGGRAVFDQDKNRLDLVSLADKQTAGQISNPSPTAVFSTLAVFNPEDTLLVTAGGEGELKGGLQVWTVPPAGGRGAEAARLFTPGRLPVTTAAFSPSKGQRFLVVGTEKGTVHLWKPPAGDRPAYTGKVVNVDSTDPRYVTVRVEFDNRLLGLLDRSAANVIIPQAE